MDGPVGAEIQDWEVLHDSKSELSGEKSTKFEGLEGESDSEGLIKSDYFSLANQGKLARTLESERDLSEEGSVESDNPSWVDPGPENRYGRINSGEFWSDSGSDRSDERKTNEFDSRIELGRAENERSQMDHGEWRAGDQKLLSLELYESKISEFDPKSELFFTNGAKDCLDFEEFDEIQPQGKDLSKFWSDSGGDALFSAKSGDVASGESGSEVKVEGVDGQNKELPIEETKVNAESGGGCGEKRKVVWWKVPFEVLKYCMFRANPVWSFSVAAAMMGFIILGRKLYKMKRKGQGLQLKVALDDKKVSQFMSRAARLNEAFSVVRRVPMVRPALPAAGNGINPWPAMSMR